MWIEVTTVAKQVPPAVLYVGPDQLMPLTSLLGALAGILLMFWNRVLGGVRWLRRKLTGRPADENR